MFVSAVRSSFDGVRVYYKYFDGYGVHFWIVLYLYGKVNGQLNYRSALAC